MLSCAAVCCSVLQCTAVYYRGVRVKKCGCVAVSCGVLQCIAVMGQMRGCACVIQFDRIVLV